MDVKPDYTGTHKVVLPLDYLNSIDAAVELYEDEIAEVAIDLHVSGLQGRAGLGGLSLLLIGMLVWLGPTGWMICL
jgi:hypothetical protein